MEKIKENKMGYAPMLPLIVSMSLPSMFSMLIQALYNIVDSIFVARYSDNALTAVSLAFPIQMLLIAIAVGTGIGINSLVSRKLGERDFEQANKAATHGLVITVASWIIFAIAAIIAIKPFFRVFAQSEITYQMSCSYTYIVSVFSIGVFIQVYAEKTLQATGNMIYPMLLQLVGAIINIILDPIMIFGYFGFPEMGIAGAAIATVTGQIIAMLLAIFFLFFKKNEVHISLRNFRFDVKTVKDIYAVGLPAIIMQAIGSFLNTFLNMILSGFSEIAVSVLGVYYKLQSFVFMPVFGLTHGVMPVIGYCYGARNKKRMTSALKIGCFIAFGIMLIGTLVFWMFTKNLLAIFNNNAELIETGIPALRIISLCFTSAAIGIMFSTFFQAIGDGQKSLLISLLRQIVLILPVAYLLSKIGLKYVWFAFPIAEVVALVVSISLFIWTYRTKIKNLIPLRDMPK